MILFGLLSCAAPDYSMPSTTNATPDLSISVDIGKKEVTSPIINSDAGIGPQFSDLSTNPQNKVEKVRALFFAEGGMHALSYLGVIKAMENEGQSYAIVSGAGMGAILAAFYCAGIPSDQVEWFFYKLGGELRAEQANFLSKSWLSLVEKSLQKQFGQQTLQSFKHTCTFPIYSPESNSVEYYGRGKIVPILMANLRYSSQSGEGRSPVIYPFDPVKELQRLGAEETLMVYSDLTQLQFLKWDGFLLGIFGKVTSLNMELKSAFDFNVEMHTGNIPIDRGDQFPELIQIGVTDMTSWLQKESEDSIMPRGNNEE